MFIQMLNKIHFLNIKMSEWKTERLFCFTDISYFCHPHLTFLGLLKNRGWGCSHLHCQSIGPSERVAVPHDEAARLLVLQDTYG